MIHKQFAVEKEGDWLVVNTAAVDRDRDRVLPNGAVLDNYLRNPVVMYGHNYRDPWALIGRAAELEAGVAGIRMRPELREPASEGDPMHIILALWEGGLLRAASIGFRPVQSVENEVGGRDYTAWELLEVSLVPIPSNQEALRLAVKGLSRQDGDREDPEDTGEEEDPGGAEQDSERTNEIQDEAAEDPDRADESQDGATEDFNREDEGPDGDPEGDREESKDAGEEEEDFDEAEGDPSGAVEGQEDPDDGLDEAEEEPGGVVEGRQDREEDLEEDPESDELSDSTGDDAEPAPAAAEDQNADAAPSGDKEPSGESEQLRAWQAAFLEWVETIRATYGG